MPPPWLERAQRTALLATAFVYSAGYATGGLFLILLTVIAEAVVLRKLPWRRSGVDWLLLGFLVVFLLSGWLSRFPATATGAASLAALSIYLAFGPLYRILQRDRAFLANFFGAWIAGAVLAAMWAIYLHRATGSPAFTPELGQNAVGTTLLISLLIGLGFLLGASGILRYVLLFACAILSLGVALTYTRGAWLGAAFGLLLFFFLTAPRQGWRVLVLLVLVVVLGGLFVGSERSALLQRARTIVSVASNLDRVYLFQSARAILADHPLIGTGLNTFVLVYPSYRLPNDPNPPIQPFAHNVFLNMAAEGGILGLATFAGILVWAAVAGWRWYAAATSRQEVVMSAATLSALVGMLVHQFVDGTIISVHVGAGMWFLIAILTALNSQNRQQRSPT